MSRITVGDWSTRWVQGQSRLKPQTHERCRNIVRVQILAEWGNVRLSAIAQSDVVAWVAKLVAEGYAASTVRQVRRVFSLLLELALRDGRLPRNPAAGVRLPRAAKGEPVFLTHGQVEELAQACAGYELLVRVLAYTGMRWGEATAARWSMPWPSTSQARGPTTWCSPLRDGDVMRHNFRSRVFVPAARWIGMPGLTPHDLRHTAASLAVQAGANVKALQRMLGHASAAMTLDVYAGLFGDDLDAWRTAWTPLRLLLVRTLCDRGTEDGRPASRLRGAT